MNMDRGVMLCVDPTLATVTLPEQKKVQEEPVVQDT